MVVISSGSNYLHTAKTHNIFREMHGDAPLGLHIFYLSSGMEKSVVLRMYYSWDDDMPFTAT